jgi:NAD(P)H-dependent flavin oxidoreductase YrpB (nitropropane dioxygenase family)
MLESLEIMKHKNTLCKKLGVRHPIIQAPIGSATCPELASAVSNAGGLGTIAASWTDPGELRQVIKATRELTDKPFGVNLVLEWPQIERLKVSLDQGVRIISTFWGDPGEIVEIAHKAGALVIHTVGSSSEAKQAVKSGVDIIVAQGWEAGGHVWGDVSLQALVPAVVDAVPDTPVVAAGGIADGRGIASAFALGASGVWIGTRFLASKEAAVQKIYKQKIIEAFESDTKYSRLFDIGWPNAPHRVLRNSTVERWEEAGSPAPGKRPLEGETVARDKDGNNILRYSDTIPTLDLEGDLEALALFAGQSTGLIHDVKPAGEIVKTLVTDTQRVIDEVKKDIEGITGLTG